MTIRRIAFVSGEFSPGRDGVGDMIHRLAAALIARGIACMEIALNSDNANVDDYEMPVPGGAMRVLRLPAALPRRRRKSLAATALAEFAPDWVSLNFVSYGFNRKGVPFAELFWLPSLLRPFRLHVLVHELWVGQPGFGGFKNGFWRLLQRPFVIALLRRLNPRLIDTTNPYYCQQLLDQSGLRAGILPLFSSLPVTRQTADAWLWADLRNVGVPIEPATRQRYWLFGMMGAAYDWWPIDGLFKALVRIGSAHGRKIVIVAIGKGSDDENRRASLRAAYPDIAFLGLGTKPAEAISAFFNSVDFGLNQTPLYLIGKSSVAAVMLEHGLPVITSWGDLEPGRSWLSTPLAHLVWPCDDRLEVLLVRHRRVHPDIDMRSYVVERMLAEMEAAA